MKSATSTFPFDDPKTRALARILSASATPPLREVLVVGSGKGGEAAVLSDELTAHVIGIDIEAEFDQTASTFADLRRGDATQLEFPDNYFDAVYSFHALEHIPNYRQALTEMWRVLRPTGSWLIGTPNRERLLGYLGSKSATLAEKVSWNINDWKARLKGRFGNEFGAHAGYSSSELYRELDAVFSEVREITLPYYLEVYASKRLVINALSSLGVARWAFPAVYFLGRK